MKVYQRAATPPFDFLVDSVDGWTLSAFVLWQELLEAAARPAPTVSEYLAEGVVDHYLAYTKDGRLIGSAQVCVDQDGRYHIHRLVVHPEYRGNQVAAELVRLIDNDYEDTQLWAFVDDGADLKGLLELYLFEEAPDARQPTTFRLASGTRQEHSGSAAGAGDGGGVRPAVAGADAPTAGRGAGAGDRDDGAGVGARRGKRGGRRRKKGARR